MFNCVVLRRFFAWYKVGFIGLGDIACFCLPGAVHKAESNELTCGNLSCDRLVLLIFCFRRRCLLHLFAAAKRVVRQWSTKGAAWFKLLNLLFEGGHFVLLSFFACNECCSCRFVSDIMGRDPCNMQRYFSSVFDGFAAFSRHLCWPQFFFGLFFL